MNLFYPFVWLLIGGLLRLFDFGRKTIPLAAWLSPIFLLHFAHTVSPLGGLLLIWLVMFLAACFAYREVIPIPGIGFPVTVAAISLTSVLPYLADRLLYARLAGAMAPLVFPAAWVVMEFVTAHASPFGSWGAAAYTQHDDHPLMQLASVTGLSGISFLMAWFGSTMNWAWENQFNWTTIEAGVALYAAVWAVIMLAGGARLAFAEPGKTVRVASIGWSENILPQESFVHILAPAGLPAHEREEVRQCFGQLQDYFVEATRREAQAGARIVVWPEATLLIFKADEPSFIERAQQLAAEHRIHLLMGMGTVNEGKPPKLENKAVLLNPLGEIVYSYIKKNPVPGWEAQVSVRSDNQIPTYASKLARLASAICFDMDFPQFIRQAGTDIMLVPASDWEPIEYIHNGMAAFRAVENGASLVRATRWGISAAVDPFGRTLATTNTSCAEQDVMVAQVGTKGVRTLYARAGDWFAWLCLISLGAMAAWTLVGAL